MDRQLDCYGDSTEWESVTFAKIRPSIGWPPKQFSKAERQFWAICAGSLLVISAALGYVQGLFNRVFEPFWIAAFIFGVGYYWHFKAIFKDSQRSKDIIPSVLIPVNTAVSVDKLQIADTDGVISLENSGLSFKGEGFSFQLDHRHLGRSFKDDNENPLKKAICVDLKPVTGIKDIRLTLRLKDTVQFEELLNYIRTNKTESEDPVYPPILPPVLPIDLPSLLKLVIGLFIALSILLTPGTLLNPIARETWDRFIFVIPGVISVLILASIPLHVIENKKRSRLRSKLASLGFPVESAN